MLESGEIMTMSALPGLRWMSMGMGRGEPLGESPIVAAAEEPKEALVGVTVTVRWGVTGSRGS
jgi:hypothetical protein